MKHALRMIGYGIGGLAVAAALSLGAFALAGNDISEPVQAPGLPAATVAPHDRKPPADAESPKPSDHGSPNASPTLSDDHGGTGSGGSTPSPSENSGSGSTPTGTPSGSGGEHDDSRPGGEDD